MRYEEYVLDQMENEPEALEFDMHVESKSDCGQTGPTTHCLFADKAIAYNRYDMRSKSVDYLQVFVEDFEVPTPSQLNQIEFPQDLVMFSLSETQLEYVSYSPNMTDELREEGYPS